MLVNDFALPDAFSRTSRNDSPIALEGQGRLSADRLHNRRAPKKGGGKKLSSTGWLSLLMLSGSCPVGAAWIIELVTQKRHLVVRPDTRLSTFQLVRIVLWL